MEDGMKKCEFCKDNVEPHQCGYWNVGVDSIDLHVSCGEQMITVFKVMAIGEKNYFYDIDMPQMSDLMDGADIGEGYTITKESMTALQYYSLPEFQGF